ncbi:hypothetical protein QE152_g23653 [Popillia japonica]|uniref:Uncharacterized protein n=1 Tax=Popillia japonica TaxID=7064 RepID=A0AAW1KGV2_POPJA
MLNGYVVLTPLIKNKDSCRGHYFFPDECFVLKITAIIKLHRKARSNSERRSNITAYDSQSRLTFLVIEGQNA